MVIIYLVSVVLQYVMDLYANLKHIYVNKLILDLHDVWQFYFMLFLSTINFP